MSGVALPTDARLSAAHIGLGLTTTEAANLSTRVNSAMAAIGANVYADDSVTPPIPPAGQVLLVDENGDYLIDDSGNYLTGDI